MLERANELGEKNSKGTWQVYALYQSDEVCTVMH